jgi:hypothetical protein
VTFACRASTEIGDFHELVVGEGEPCASSEGKPGCIRMPGDTISSAISCIVYGVEGCDGVPVASCDEEVARALTATTVEGWECWTVRDFSDPTCGCRRDRTTDGGVSNNPTWTYPCPPIVDQCCRYRSDYDACECTTGDGCADLAGVEVSACPVPDAEMVELDLGD